MTYPVVTHERPPWWPFDLPPGGSIAPSVYGFPDKPAYIYLGRDNEGRETWAQAIGGFYSTVVYPEAWEVLGAMYGGWPGVGLFRLPDFRGRVVVGVGQ